MTDYYDRDGKPIGDVGAYVEWSRQHFPDRDAADSYRRIGDDSLGEVRVSTVWLGLDHNWYDGPPLIFETMVFGGDRDEYGWRYATEAEALAGHAEVCSAVLR